MKTYLSFWGKARANLQNEPSYHPLAYHCLDVAAVADALFAANPRRLSALANLLQTTSENARRVLLCLIALHDVGKFTSAFQSKSVDAWPVDVLGVHVPLDGGRHDEDGYAMGGFLEFRALMPNAFTEWERSEIFTLWAATTGHHGKPATARGPDGLQQIKHFKILERGAAQSFAKDVAELFGPFSSIPVPLPRNLAICSWALAGLTVISDWIGSDRSKFPYTKPTFDIQGYWAKAQTIARAAVAQSGILPVEAASNNESRLLLSNFDPSPLQRMALKIALPEAQMLAIVEDTTGSGKTEAALLIAARLLADGRADGLFFALPTMATANAMYQRLARNAANARTCVA